MNRSLISGALLSIFTSIFVSSASMANIDKREHYRAWCDEHRYSPGGWMSYRDHAESHRDDHQRSFPGHTVYVITEKY